MARPAIFPCDTTLYHPTEGARTFPQGEQDPGPLWTETAGGNPVGSGAVTEAMKALIEAEERIENLGAQLAAKDHDLAVLAKERDEAIAAYMALKQQVDNDKAAASLGAVSEPAPAAAEPTPEAAPEPAPASEPAAAEPTNPEAPAAETISPPDNDGNGEPGGSLKAEALDDIPAEYAKLPWFTMRALARKYAGDTPIENKPDAVAAIEAELARRAAA